MKALAILIPLPNLPPDVRRDALGRDITDIEVRWATDGGNSSILRFHRSQVEVKTITLGPGVAFQVDDQ